VIRIVHWSSYRVIAVAMLVLVCLRAESCAERSVEPLYAEVRSVSECWEAQKLSGIDKGKAPACSRYSFGHPFA